MGTGQDDTEQQALIGSRSWKAASAAFFISAVSVFLRGEVLSRECIPELLPELS